MSPTIVLTFVFVLIVLAVVVFVAVVVGIHSEPRYGMAAKAQRPLAALARRLLGVHVIRPVVEHDDHREECLAGQSTDWWNTGGGDQ